MSMLARQINSMSRNIPSRMDSESKRFRIRKIAAYSMNWKETCVVRVEKGVQRVARVEVGEASMT